jgi:predicted peroxiredoxin
LNNRQLFPRGLTLEGIRLVVKRVNITVDPKTLDEFYRLAAKKGIKFSTWVQVKMEEFIEEEKMIEEFRQKKRSE